MPMVVVVVDASTQSGQASTPLGRQCPGDSKGPSDAYAMLKGVRHSGVVVPLSGLETMFACDLG
jgi:hypothetical protein